MKAKSSSIITTGNDSRYLKPGALAQLRDSRIRKPQISLYQLVSASLAAAETALIHSGAVPAAAPIMDAGFPCFDLRSYRAPRCLRRKKLVAVTPIFAGPSSQT